ncbi:MAG: ABC transporter permease, partial [Sulfuritalea sp.]|nr:ABC transporter permease [Sulfuritalea sp.]
MVILASSFRLALRMLARDWRAGELTVLGIALMLAVAALTSVGFLTDRVEQALKLESHQLLGGDLLLTADHPWADKFRREAAARGLRQAESATFPSMVSLGGAALLAEIKAVSAGYPLRGALRTAPLLNAADAETPRVPQAGEAWPDERLATTLSLAAGTSLALGKITMVSGPVLTLEPDRGMNVFALAPRLMINLADLPATGLIQSGSRVGYRLHLAGDAAAVAAYEVWAKGQLGRGEKIESLDNARPEIRNVTERAQRFLRLAALLAVILAAVAVALAAERYMRRHLDGCAVMRCMGASAQQLLLIHGGEFLLFGLAATLAGCAAGYAV